MLSYVLAFGVLFVLLAGFCHRLVHNKGIGVQFTRSMVTIVTPLLAALLALNDAIPDAVLAALLAGPFGYVLGKRSAGPVRSGDADEDA